MRPSVRMMGRSAIVLLRSGGNRWGTPLDGRTAYGSAPTPSSSDRLRHLAEPFRRRWADGTVGGMRARGATIVLLALALSACGGGGDSTTGPASSAASTSTSAAGP